MKHSPDVKGWAPEAVANRVDRARGALLARTGKSLLWADIARRLQWASSATAAEVRAGRRPLRVAEIGEIAQLLECSPGWLAFGEGVMRWTPDTPGVQTEEDDDPRSPVAERPLPKQRQSVTAPAQRPAKRAGGRGGR